MHPGGRKNINLQTFRKIPHLTLSQRYKLLGGKKFVKERVKILMVVVTIMQRVVG